MDIVYATATVYVPLPDGGRILVRAGTHWPATDPLVLAHPDMFSSNPVYGLSFSSEPAEPVVEQASAAPGEKRGPDPRSIRRAV